MRIIIVLFICLFASVAMGAGLWHGRIHKDGRFHLVSPKNKLYYGKVYNDGRVYIYDFDIKKKKKEKFGITYPELNTWDTEIK